MDLEEQFEQAVALQDEGKNDEAEQIFLQLDKVAPQVIGVKMNLAAIEESRGNTDKAITYLKAALEYEPSHPNLLKRLAEVTNDSTYTDKLLEIEQTVIPITASEYYQVYVNNEPALYEEFTMYELELSGQVDEIDTIKSIIYLKTNSTLPEQRVACYKAETWVDKVAKGEDITLYANSLGMQDGNQNPVVLVTD